MSVQIGRRTFLGALSGAAVTWPVWAQGLGKERPRVAWLSGSASRLAKFFADDLVAGMRDFGYIESRDFEFVPRYAEGFQDRLTALAQEIVALKPSVIVAAAVNAAVPARAASQVIPIVCPALADAVHLGLIASEARPGGNVTGIEPYVTGLPAKQLEVAREVVPGARRIGLLTNLKDPKAPPQRQELAGAAKAMGLAIAEADISSPVEIERAMQALASLQVDAVIVLQTGLLLSVGPQIAQLAATKRLPTIYGYREHVMDGGLISYGVDLRWCYHRAAYFVDKILHGTPPGELPVEFPTKMTLSINLKAAKALGLTLPPTLLSFADEVIE
ncbi:MULTISPECIES: ABC transporter substrate-binding protein [unclassified Bradyrhizobium]|uniref:ABC transporter substrate-binding protein n=1 Tax=unclassified Bradyrhizobium TaxID=2631580 RepID=UPI002479493C|nr:MULTISPECIES: ABC transporter substrate-binding protein [unclassified Bradyrhizobium]WGR68225.1 ABC transporter substrate-binding protein [Bradyrhizobium sp. ISRA426]WGR80280.1 ABC transporter substrate-binding protein [Bradyrhizobium sp. ISRA430]WGR83465.1 ABC transporter substrate-binding protein [Bradyrhizobium sp. ISRA432]